MTRAQDFGGSETPARPVTPHTLCACGHERRQHNDQGVCQASYCKTEPGKTYSGVDFDPWRGPTLLCGELDEEGACKGFAPGPPCPGCGAYDGEGDCSECGS